MDDNDEDSYGVLLGSAVIAFVEVIPIAGSGRLPARSHYEVLRVEKTAELETIQASYEEQQIQLAENTELSSNARSIELDTIQRAWDCLRDPESRKAYDERLAREWTEEDGHDPAQDDLSAPFAKLHLKQLSTVEYLGIQWDQDVRCEEDEQVENQKKISPRLQRCFLFASREPHTSPPEEKNMPKLFFPSQNPIAIGGIPCLVIGYAILSSSNYTSYSRQQSSKATITSGTLVRILPPMTFDDGPSPPWLRQIDFLEELSGELESRRNLNQQLQDELEHNHSAETIQELKLCMSIRLAEPICIGTTSDAFLLKQKQQARRRTVTRAIQSRFKLQPKQDHNQGPSQPTTSTSQQEGIPSILRDGALVVHSPRHGSGKTILVQHIARNLLNCKAVHVLRPAALLAKYGSQADAGLESILHSLVMSAAVAPTQSDQASICIVLDQFDCMMPPPLSNRSGAGDAAVPVLNAIASYLKTLVLSLKHRRQFPFPTKNPLYNVGGKGGVVLSVRLCLVAVVTCPDNGWRSTNTNSHSTGILDALSAGTYRLPNLNAPTRFRAFQWAFEQDGLDLSQEAQDSLLSLATAAVWARGNQFFAVASRARESLETHSRDSLLPEDLEEAFATFARHTPGTPTVKLQRSNDTSSGPQSASRDPFGIVGGSEEAKKSLRDSLMLDSSKRALMESMGINSPVGVLFYGPPGCGKTLLAKAVARFLGAQGASSGAFIALNSSDVVQAEVGTSEKLIVSSFIAARESAPAVIFIDEFQALFTERSSSGSSKLTSTLLQCMDDIKQWRKANSLATYTTTHDTEKKRVVVLGATNTPWSIDKAFLRPGRFDRIVHVGLPSEADRESILKVHMRRMRLSGGATSVEPYSKTIAEKTNGFSGADLAALCRAAATKCLLEECISVTESHFLQELEAGTFASSNADLVRRNQQWKRP